MKYDDIYTVQDKDEQWIVVKVMGGHMEIAHNSWPTKEQAEYHAQFLK